MTSLSHGVTVNFPSDEQTVEANKLLDDTFEPQIMKIIVNIIPNSKVGVKLGCQYQICKLQNCNMCVYSGQNLNLEIFLHYHFGYTLYLIIIFTMARMAKMIFIKFIRFKVNIECLYF